jgi:trehalose 6-phosphate synthase
LSDDFWKRVQAASRRVLMLDYDGTLAPFHPSRMEARPPDATLDILRAIVESGHTQIVIVSGRPAREARGLLSGLTVDTFGSHGFERFPADGSLHELALSQEERAGFDAAAAAVGAAGLGERLEVKSAGIAVHVRGLDHAKAIEIEELSYNILKPIADRYHLECRLFDGGVEIRSGRFHKGLAVSALLDELTEDTFAVYVGDDDTDEDAFRALSGRGIGVRVGAPASDTAAQIQLALQADVLPFLEKWHRCASRRQHVVVKERPPRLVVVSNRLPSVEASAESDRRRPVGGLVSALEAALTRNRGGGLWMGWTGSITEERTNQLTETAMSDLVRLIGVDLTQREYEAYYNGFSNRTIWPIFHSFPTLAELSRWQLELYRAVNATFAQSLTSVLRENDLVWVHDYHLMFLAEALRQFGWARPVGFFLHIPFPSLDLFAILPRYADFLNALLAYDLIGFQTAPYRDNYVYACRRALGAAWDGSFLRVGERKQRVGVYPVGIAVENFAPAGGGSRSTLAGGSLRANSTECDLILGVDRLDYTKGMPQRVLAFETLLKQQPQLKRKVSFVQICSPSRTEVDQYQKQRRAIDALVGRVNSELAEWDWEPIRYLFRSYLQDELAEFYREARVGLVTPLRDGMNLVAKEYVAAQHPDDPGVLVLSRFAGASEEMAEAVIVNPYIPEDTARGIAEALAMPHEERRRRHGALLEKVKNQTAQKWADDFVGDLEQISD